MNPPDNDEDLHKLQSADIQKDENNASAKSLGEEEAAAAAAASEGNSGSSSSESDSVFRLEPHKLIRLIQCPKCSLLLRTPLRLPCGNTICRSCLPPLKQRTGISPLQGEGREEGFTCFWKGKGCGEKQDTNNNNNNNSNLELASEHALGDCGIDIVLGRILDVFEKVLQDFEVNQQEQQHTTTEIQMQWKVPQESATTEDGVTIAPPVEGGTKATISAGRFLGTYKLVRDGRLPYDATDVVYEDTEPSSSSTDSNSKLDELVFEQLKRGIRDEVDCQVCYSLIVDPCISPCGHTYCRECASRVMDHSNLCPLCRKKMYIPSDDAHSPINQILQNILKGFFPEETKSRKAAIEEDYRYEEHELPLFVCTLAFPSMPTRLHIFEPRYRLMIRRALDYGGNRFGMIVPNLYTDTTAQANPDTPPEPFMQYGTVVTITQHEVLSDGRIILTAIGSSKFKVLRWGVLDGYYRALTERVDDISPAEEENIEAREIAAAAAAVEEPNTATNATANENEEDQQQQQQPQNDTDRDPSLAGLSTQQLMQICLDFIEKRRRETAPWLHRRVIEAFGQPPTLDPAIFPYWFASVLPIPDEEAYKLLPMTSVRARLQLAATWPKMLEENGWSMASSSCAIL